MNAIEAKKLVETASGAYRAALDSGDRETIDATRARYFAALDTADGYPRGLSLFQNFNGPFDA